MWEFLAGAALVKFFCGGSSSGSSQGGVAPSQPTSLVTVEAGKHVALRYDFGRKTGIRFAVRSSEPVDVYFVGDKEIERFRKGESISWYSSSKDVVSFDDRFVVRRGDYALLIVNRGAKTAAVSYDLWT